MFILGLSIGVSVGLMLLWQLYLVLTAQTTIEFYNNRVDSFEARSQGRVFKNPYDLGYERNCGSVFGKGAYVASAAGTAPRSPLLHTLSRCTPSPARAAAGTALCLRAGRSTAALC